MAKISDAAAALGGSGAGVQEKDLVLLLHSQGPMELATTIHRSGGCSRTARLPVMFAMLVCPLPAQL